MSDGEAIVHEEAVGLLRSTLGWQLTRRGWWEVDLVVRMLADSVDVEQYLPLLELAAPKRIATRVSDRQDDPPPATNCGSMRAETPSGRHADRWTTRSTSCCGCSTPTNSLHSGWSWRRSRRRRRG
ncbi:CATRA system-associated protein [Streptomyces sp. NBC_00151]|uniref:CATRA system-associated protein n=1 Tax=Streptomyces sp. NBC_00151 TaxID=2975669 RepID=UPI002DDAE6B5|nr:CATRA system-associated protein [Streptomyces sp. NBC_00151]WRZ37377.1 hypothetical protein OG915_04500 [Streptomyces sp. NBC_00151]